MRTVASLLVVEDDAAMHLILHDFLMNQGYSVTMATSANGAFRILDSLAPKHGLDLVLSDIQLGSLSGIDLCKSIGEQYPELPVVLFSVFDQIEKEALESGARRFLKKPFALEKLAGVLTEELGR